VTISEETTHSAPYGIVERQRKALRASVWLYIIADGRVKGDLSVHLSIPPSLSFFAVLRIELRAFVY
jgi:hypothetical protein